MYLEKKTTKPFGEIKKGETFEIYTNDCCTESVSVYMKIMPIYTNGYPEDNAILLSGKFAGQMKHFDEKDEVFSAQFKLVEI